jgi:hypothetical protein
MFGLILALSLATSYQEAAATFRAEVYVVPIEISMFTTWLGIRRPYRDLSLDDVTIVLDEQTYPPAGVAQDPKKPGHYLIRFTPPEKYRDGHSHMVTVNVTRDGASVQIPPRTITFPIAPIAAASEQPDIASAP